jgi:alpha-amylase/alpha-mannosidase (GH57 family)
MAEIYVCFVWHMHQPFYKDLVSGEYRLPWTRMHALKDYYGMVKVLEDFPQIHQTFNLVPSMMVQLEEYATGTASDIFLKRALRPAEDLTDEERDFILQYFFQANVSRLIHRYPRYSELYEAWLAADRNPERGRRLFGAQSMRDLQVLSQLAWFDEEFLEHDEEVRRLVEKERNYTLDDQALMGRKQIEICAKVIPVYQEFARSGQIEISMTPYYHPILPLVCDTAIAEVSHPNVPLPSRFRYPQDARVQLQRAQEYIRQKFGRTPDGLWPSEGSVSDEALTTAADLGLKWFATDNGVLARTLGQSAGVDQTYRPWVWRHNGREMHCLFRDHLLSDLIGFVYSRMEPADGARHFLDRVRENCRGMLARGESPVVPIILDGENAWEYYEKSGRTFLRELYRQIQSDPQITALTVTEALSRREPAVIDHVVPGSWINANFDVWLGAEEDNQAWEYLLRARQTYEQTISGPNAGALTEERKRLAFEELLVAEGSDWNWWYGPEHDSDNRPEFDQLYRDHLANVYRCLGLNPPEELSRPILKVPVKAFHEAPSSPVKPVIDGEISSYFEWMGAGNYRVDGRSGAMHGQRFLIRELFYGSDGVSLYVRVDFEPAFSQDVGKMEVRLRVFTTAKPAREKQVMLRFVDGAVVSDDGDTSHFAYLRILEGKIRLEALGLTAGQPVRFQLSLWHDGLPVDALPPQDYIEVATAELGEWAV